MRHTSITYKLVQAKFNKINKRRKSTPILEIGPEFSYTFSVSPCRPVDDRCVFVCSLDIGPLLSIYLGLKESRILGEKAKTEKKKLR